MESIQNSYRYKNLDDPQRDIRLLELLPRVSTGSIALSVLTKFAPVEFKEKLSPTKVFARLSHHRLSEALEYNALSYSWGDPSVTTAIKLDGDRNFRIPAKLELALRDLRLPDKPLIIWVDAICINQSNTNERNHQVQVMRRIYERAATVRTWLDYEIDPISPPFLKLSMITANSSVEMIGDDPKFWQPVLKIGEQRYWRRLWIQQEVAHAQRLIIYCRHHVISTDSLARFQCLVREKAFPGKTVNLAWIECGIANIKLPFNHQPLDAFSQEPVQPRRYKDILSALSSGCFYGCMNARDHVFGLLGLIADYRDGEIPVTYELPVKDCYLNVIRYALAKYQDLSFLLQISLEESNPQNELPSWMPDWSSQLLGTSMQGFESPGDDVLFKSTQIPAIISKESLLQVTGIRIGKVTAVCRGVSWDGFHNVHWAVETSLQLMKTIRARGTEDKMIGPGRWQQASQYLLDNDLERLIATLLGPKSRETKFDLQSLFRDLIASEGEEAAVAKVQDLFEDSLSEFGVDFKLLINTRTVGNQLVISQKRHFGLTRHGVREDDEFWFLCGCPMPMILRPKDPNYIVLCPGYFDGCMQRENYADMPEVVSAGERHGDFLIREIMLE